MSVVWDNIHRRCCRKLSKYLHPRNYIHGDKLKHFWTRLSKDAKYAVLFVWIEQSFCRVTLITLSSLLSNLRKCVRIVSNCWRVMVSAYNIGRHAWLYLTIFDRLCLINNCEIGQRSLFADVSQLTRVLNAVPDVVW